MELIELRTPEQALNAELRERAAQIGSGIRYTRNFLVFESGEEIAFVSLDFYPEGQPLWLYDLLVPINMRRNHVATRVLNAVEVLAKQNDYREVSLHPKSFDASFPNEELISWYKRCGHKPVAEHGRLTLSKSLYPNLDGGV